jgi:hypothetical protein
MRLWVLLTFSLTLGPVLCAADPAPPLTAGEVINRFIERARANSNRQAGIQVAFLRRTTAEQFDSKGAVTEQKTKEQLIELRGFEQAVRLLSLNGRPVTPRESSRESADESTQRKRYATRSDRNQRGNIDYLDEKLIRRFDYTLESTEKIDGRSAYRLRFRPAGEREAKEIADRVLSLLAGHIWIDAEEFELVKLDARLTRDFSFWGGVVGSLDRLELDLSRQRLADGAWVNLRLNSRIGGRKLLRRFDGRFRVEQENFRPLKPAAAP